MSSFNLERFRFEPSQLEAVKSQFQRIASAVRLHAIEANIRGAVPRASGCYFWTLRLSEAEYRIYVGRTRSMWKRFSDYANEIQIHAPNDYKLRFFQELVFETEPSASFDLYFMAVPEDHFKRREAELIREFKPFINYLRPPTSEDRKRIR